MGGERTSRSINQNGHNGQSHLIAPKQQYKKKAAIVAANSEGSGGRGLFVKYKAGNVRGINLRRSRKGKKTHTLHRLTRSRQQRLRGVMSAAISGMFSFVSK